MKRPSGPTLAALACSVLLGLLYVSPVLKDVLRTGLDWPIWIDQPEGLIHTNTGKWLVHPPHRLFVEGQSGEFPQYYAGLHDTLLNVVGSLVGAPAMTVQAVVFGPLLGSAFLLLNYLSLAAVLHDRRAALGASLLISLGGNSSFVNRLDSASGLPLEAVLHVPFHVISLATAQSLGWVLLLPSLSLAYLAYGQFSRARALGAGVCLAILFYAHTLTFVNVAAVQLAYLVLANALERPRDRRFRAWTATLAGIGLLFAALVATRPSVSFAAVAGLGTLALSATFLVDPHKRYYFWCYGPAALLALPYVALLVRHQRSLGIMQGGWNQVQMMTVGVTGFVLFFAAYLIAAGVGYRYARDRAVLVWSSAFLSATAFLAVNHLWHWSNHPYRYAIHLLFPLAVLAALGLRDAPRRLALLLGVWFLAIGVDNAWSFAAGRTLAVRFRVADPERASFLESVRSVTADEAGRGLRLLPPVELTYPRGLVQSAMLMNYALIPAFIPDYRHVLWPERYHNRMGLYCFLFPGYPNHDYPFGWRACEEALDPDPALLTMLEPRLRTGILSVYRIRYAAAPAKPFSNFLKDAGPRYGWPILTATSNAAFVRTEAATLPGVARLARADSPAETLAIDAEVERAGTQLVVLGGRQLERRASPAWLDGRPLELRLRGNWAIGTVALTAGSHRLELPSLDVGPDPQADYLYFLAVINLEQSERYIALPSRAAVRP